MKAIVSVCLVALVSAAVARPGGDDETYDPTHKHDNINLDEIMQSDRLMIAAFKCLMDQGPCTSEVDELKGILPHALETGCSKCRPKQKEGAEKVIHFLMHKKKELWKELEAKYDPTGEYSKKFEAEYERVKNKKE